MIRVESRALGRPLDPVLRVLDPGGKILAESDDTGRNSRDLERSFTAPADGEYRLFVRDLNGRGGPRFAYLLSVLEPQPDFALSLAADRFDLTPGKSDQDHRGRPAQGWLRRTNRDRSPRTARPECRQSRSRRARGRLGSISDVRTVSGRDRATPDPFSSLAGARKPHEPLIGQRRQSRDSTQRRSGFG